MADYTVQIHATADVHHTVNLGNGTAVWAGAVILEGATLGRDCIVGSGVLIGRRCLVGDGVVLQSGAYLSDETVVGNRVAIGPHAVVADVPRPCLADRTHEVRLPVVIEDDVVLGMNCSILPGVVIQAGALVGAGAVVTRDVAAGTTVVGNPARVLKSSLWLKEQVRHG